MLRSFLTLIAVASGLIGQVSQSFGGLAASPAGTVLTGQGPGAGFYLPPAPTSTDFLVYTYANNTLGIPQSPVGGCEFAAGTGPGGGTYARAQVDSGLPAGAQLTAAFDVCCAPYGGPSLPATQNIGSFSMQPFPGGQSFIALARWSDPNTATTWDADFLYFDANGVQQLGQIPVPGFQNLAVNAWHRWTVDFDLTTNLITQITLADYAVGSGPGYTPTGWYLSGGSAGSAPPTGYRLFAGGGAAGNTLAFDNICIYPVGNCLGPLPNLPEWQINQPGASLTILGQTNGGFCAPAMNMATSGVTFQLVFGSTNVGSPWDVGTTVGPLFPASGGGAFTPGGQVVNLNLGDPTLSFFFSQFQSPPFVAYSQGVNIPASALIRAQMAVVDPAMASGYSLSQGIELSVF